jgi:hypothetical protein
MRTHLKRLRAKRDKRNSNIGLDGKAYREVIVGGERLQSQLARDSRGRNYRVMF